MTREDIRLALAERAVSGFEGPRTGEDFDRVTREWESATVGVVRAARERAAPAVLMLETLGRGLALMAAPVVELEHEGAA